MKKMGGKRRGRMRGVDEVVEKIGVNIRRSHMFAWGGDIHLLL